MGSVRRNPYATLGVSRTASLLEIARARRRLAKQHHPDLAASADAVERMQAINAAWEILSNPVARRAWDAGSGAPTVGTAVTPEWAYPSAAWRQPAGVAGSSVDPPAPAVARGWQDSGWVAAAFVALLAIAIFVVAVIATDTVAVPPAPDAPWVQGNYRDN